MKRMKKAICLIMVLIMTASLFAGCGKSGDKTITLTCYSQLANYSGNLTGWFGQILKEKFNVVINIIPDTDGIYETRMESGNLGDLVIWGSDGNDYKNAVRAGMLLDWNEDDLLSELGPYIKENMPYALEKNANLLNGDLTATDESGNLLYPDAADYTGITYGFGHNVATSPEDHESFFYTWDIRWDLYKELGYPQVKDLDDLYDLFVNMKEIEPTDQNGQETYAMSLWPDWDGSMVMYVKSMVTAYYGYDELGIGNYNDTTGEYYDCLDPDGPYIQMMKWFNKLYRAGLLDPDSMTQTYDEMSDKVKAGGTFFSIFNYAGSYAFNTDENMANDQMMCAMVPDEATPIVYGMNVEGGNRVWTIGAKTKYPELCMEIINWFCTPEGRMTMDYGPKDVMWYYDEDGYSYFTELGRTVQNDRKYILTAEEAGGYSGEFNGGACQLNNTTWSTDAENPDSIAGEKYNWKTWSSQVSEPLCDMDADWRSVTGVKTTDQYMESHQYRLAYATSYSESGKDAELTVTWTQVTKCIVSGTWNCIYAKTDEEFDATLNQMIQDCNDYGYDKCLEWSLNEAAIKNTLEEPLR